MNTVLFSNDENLADFCREILVDMFGLESKLDVGLPNQLRSQEDLCLWDFIPGEMAIPPDVDPVKLRKHLFLVHREDLPALQERLGTSQINVLLKPITAATVRAFFSDAHRQRIHNGNPARSIDTLRCDRDEMLQLLIQANLKLHEYDEERANFVARCIHDSQAPLTAISGYCGLLLEEELGPLTSEQREVLGRMQHSVTRLSRIATSMCQLSIRPNGDQELNLEQGDMHDCIDRALHEVAPFLADKRITASVEIEQPLGLFFTKSQMEQTLVNLLDNACKFTARDGTIEIRGYPFFWERRTCRGASQVPSKDRRIKQVRTPNSMRVDIRDSGPGIPTAQLTKIFEEHTAYSGRQDRSGGGLGLAICRLILQQHGGKIWAESHTAGAAFSFVLPVRSIDTHAPDCQEGLAKACLAGFEESRP